MKNLSLFPQSARRPQHSTEVVKVGELIPFSVIETAPGDQFILVYEAEFLSVNEEVSVDVDFFYVPLATIWALFNSWRYDQRHIELPFISPNGATWEPGTVFTLLEYSIASLDKGLPFRLAAYAAIWNEFYRLPEERERNCYLFPGENDEPGYVYSSREGVDPNCFYPQSRPLPRNWGKNFDTFVERGSIKHIGGCSFELKKLKKMNKNVKVLGSELLVQPPVHGLIVGLIAVGTNVTGERPAYDRGILATYPDPDPSGYFPIYGSFVERHSSDRIFAVTKETGEDVARIENAVDLYRLIPKRPV